MMGFFSNDSGLVDSWAISPEQVFGDSLFSDTYAPQYRSTAPTDSTFNTGFDLLDSALNSYAKYRDTELTWDLQEAELQQRRLESSVEQPTRTNAHRDAPPGGGGGGGDDSGLWLMAGAAVLMALV